MPRWFTLARAKRVALAALPILGLILVLSSLHRRAIYFPFGTLPTPAAAGLPSAEQVTFRTDDGLDLGGWFVPALPPANGHTVIVFNGNGGNRAMRAPLASALASRHVSTLLFDYRGYGGNGGSPSEEGLAADARAAQRYAASRHDVDPAKLSYFGESLGTGVAVRLAAERPPDTLVLRSPFTSLTEVGRHHYPLLPVGLLLRDRFRSEDRIRLVRCPVLIIAGERDRVVPVHLSRALYESANEPKRLLLLENADHNDFELLAGRSVMDAVADWVLRTG